MTEVVNNVAPEVPAEELVEVTSIPQFAAMVAAWHHNVVGQLNQGLAVPDDVSIHLTLIGDTDEVELNSDQRLGFKAGLVMALALLSELPFQGIADPVPATQAGDDEGTGQ